jgi:chromosome segregation ATPase|eukprot:COSAG01_NODE_546_length_15649_cov_21.047395_8_plen_449_part_00
MDDSLVQQFEELMAKVSTTRNITQQKEDEIKRLTMEAQKRAAAVPVGQSDAVVKLRQEVQQRQVDLEQIRRNVAEKERQNAQYVQMLEQEQEQLKQYSADDSLEERQIDERRRQNDALQAEVRQLTGQLSLLAARQQNVEVRLGEKEQQVQEAKRRNEQNAQTERDFAAQLQDLEQLKQQHAQKEELLTELNMIIEEMDESFEQVDGVAETLQVERMGAAGASGPSTPADFERSPMWRLWLGSTAAALATMKVVRFGERRGQTWVTPMQLEQARGDVCKRLAEVDTVKRRLRERVDQLKEEVAAARQQLAAKSAERDAALHERDELQRILDDPEGAVRSLETMVPELEAQKMAAEREEASVRDEWERVEASAQSKYAQAKEALDEQLELLKYEEQKTTEINSKVGEFKRKEKHALFQAIQREADELECAEEHRGNGATTVAAAGSDTW